MGLDYLGELDGAEGVAERKGRSVAQIELRDARVREFIEVPMVGGKVGKKPGRVTGYVAIRFSLVDDGELAKHLREVVERKRGDDLEFDVVLDDGKRLGPCTIGGPQGSSSIDPASFWFTLEF
jgi:hypothetical protein